MTNEERVIECLRQLPADRQAEVLDFVEFLIGRLSSPQALRPYGLCAGEFQVPDDFDAPLPESELRLFE
jgi:hypothetical protein